MTLTPDIIQQAYRESNLVLIGAALTDGQSTEGLSILNRLVSGAYGYEVGEEFFDWPVGTDGMLVPNDGWTEHQWRALLPQARIVCMQESAQTLYMPPNPSDGARIAFIDPQERCPTYPITLDGNGRDIGSDPTVLIDTSAPTTWFYRADLGRWVVLSALAGTVGEEFPFPMEFDDYFITKTAMRLNPRYGRSVTEETAIALDQTLSKLRSRYRQEQLYPCDLGAIALTPGYGDFLGRAPDRSIVRRPLSRGGRVGWMP